MLLDDLFAEARRQLSVCNSCRYCEGYCPVWPALELRTALSDGDVTHLANLCHDCRDCFTACMYTAPHEFDLNPPQLFAEVREATYNNYVWPRSVPGWLGGYRGIILSFLAISGLLTALSCLTTGGEVFAGPKTGSAYELIPHILMVVVVTAPTVWAVGVLFAAVVKYWRETHGSFGDLGHFPSWSRTLRDAAALRHMTGGDEGCAYPGSEPSSARRRLHHAVSYGFLLCLLSTTSAAFMQELLGMNPPYDYLSAPVISGTLGGAGMVVGCTGLIALQTRSERELGSESMRRADYGFLWALLILSLTGLLTLVVRATSLFAPVFVVHLASVIVAFAVAPYTKFVHWVYRLLAIYKHNLDQARSARSRVT
jgi:citrate/tricarballylate utilization protein